MLLSPETSPSRKSLFKKVRSPVMKAVPATGRALSCSDRGESYTLIYLSGLCSWLAICSTSLWCSWYWFSISWSFTPHCKRSSSIWGWNPPAITRHCIIFCQHLQKERQSRQTSLTQYPGSYRARYNALVTSWAIFVEADVWYAVLNTNPTSCTSITQTVVWLNSLNFFVHSWGIELAASVM
jgi:hypothetical protein